MNIPNEPGVYEIDQLTIHKAERITQNGKTFWLSINGSSTKLKVTEKMLGELAIDLTNLPVSGPAVIERRLETNGNQQHKVPWLKSFAGKTAALPGTGNQNDRPYGNRSTKNYEREAAVIRGLAEIIASCDNDQEAIRLSDLFLSKAKPFLEAK